MATQTLLRSPLASDATARHVEKRLRTMATEQTLRVRTDAMRLLVHAPPADRTSATPPPPPGADGDLLSIGRIDLLVSLWAAALAVAHVERCAEVRADHVRMAVAVNNRLCTAAPPATRGCASHAALVRTLCDSATARGLVLTPNAVGRLLRGGGSRVLTCASAQCLCKTDAELAELLCALAVDNACAAGAKTVHPRVMKTVVAAHNTLETYLAHGGASPVATTTAAVAAATSSGASTTTTSGNSSSTSNRTTSARKSAPRKATKRTPTKRAPTAASKRRAGAPPTPPKKRAKK